MTDQKETRVILDLSLEQAEAVSRALDIYTRLGIGQMVSVSEMVLSDEVALSPTLRKNEYWIDDVRLAGTEMAMMIGYHPGTSAGIGRAPIKASRTYEVGKVLDKVLAIHRNPNPQFRGVNYDGLVVRYTCDPAPVATIKTEDAV